MRIMSVWQNCPTDVFEILTAHQIFPSAIALYLCIHKINSISRLFVLYCCTSYSVEYTGGECLLNINVITCYCLHWDNLTDWDKHESVCFNFLYQQEMQRLWEPEECNWKIIFKEFRIYFTVWQLNVCMYRRRMSLCRLEIWLLTINSINNRNICTAVLGATGRKVWMREN